MAARAPVAEQSPQLLAVLGARLRAKNIDANAFMTRVVSAYPADFWVNIEMGNALYHQSKPLEAIGFYRTALALRPETLSLRYALGDLYHNLHRWDEAIAEYEQALRLAPDNAWCHNRLGFALAWKGGRDDEAITHTREAVRIDPNEGWFHYSLGFALDHADRFDEAAAELREACDCSPKNAPSGCETCDGRCCDGGARRGARRLERGAGSSSARARRLVRLRRAVPVSRRRNGVPPRPPRPVGAVRHVTDPVVAERVARACLLLPAPEDELQQAVALTERAVAAGRMGHEAAYPYFLFTQGLAGIARAGLTRPSS